MRIVRREFLHWQIVVSPRRPVQDVLDEIYGCFTRRDRRQPIGTRDSSLPVDFRTGDQIMEAPLRLAERDHQKTDAEQ